MPFVLGSGSLAGPSTAWYLADHLPATPERDLLRAMAHQQSGEDGKAEALYRSLRQFAESWNNLGVLLKKRGREPEARKAFEEALKIDPGLAEAELNLGRPARTLWTELHKKYLSGRPMIAPPRRAHYIGAFFEGSATKAYLHTLAGPFAGSFDALYIYPTPTLRNVVKAMAIGIMVLMALSVAILFIVPSHDVAQPPGKMLWTWELLLPGKSPAWRVLAGPALLGWSYFLLQVYLVIQ